MLCLHIIIPSGDPTPSNDDILVTKRLAEAGKLLNIPLLDHVVIGADKGAIYSFRENHPEMFESTSWDMSLFPELSKTAEVVEPESMYTDSLRRPDQPRASVIGRLSEKKELSYAPVGPDKGRHEPSL